jgi:aminoglycoside phosphotransferase (APT) family kinase protein
MRVVSHVAPRLRSVVAQSIHGEAAENCDVLAAHGDAEGSHLLREGIGIAARLRQLPSRQPVLCHGDPDVGNFIGEGPVLIDFEYAQSADPTYDLALLLDYYPALAVRLSTLQKAMGLEDELSCRRLPLQRELAGIVNAAWARAQRLLARALD